MTILRASDSQEQDAKAMAESVAYAWYIPTKEEMVRHYRAPKHDELECYLKVRDDLAGELQAWLDRAAGASKLLPAIRLDGLYFHSDELTHGMPGPRWEDFLAMKSPGTFEFYHITFKSVR